MSRLRILALFAALAALTTAFAACGSSSSSSNENPETVIKEATFKGIENANLDAKVGIEANGKEEGHVKVELSGPFQAGAPGELPELELTAKSEGSVSGNSTDFEGGLTLLPGKAYVNFKGTDYEVEPTTFSYIESLINRAKSEGGAEGESSGSTECQEAAAENLKVSDLVDNLKNEGSAQVGGTETTKVSGELNVPGAIADVVKLIESPACRAQLESAGPLQLAKLAKAKGEIESALKSGKVDVYVGEDHIVRRITAQLTVEPQGAGETAEVEIDVSLSNVNEGQDISAPESAEPLQKLFLKLGINPIELLQATSGGAGLGGLLKGVTGGGGGSAGSGLQGLIPNG